MRRTVPDSTVFTHLEPIEDPASFQDEGLEREPRREESAGAGGELK
jgi:hypothetical protein